MPKWSPREIDAMMNMATKTARQIVNWMYPEIPENTEIRNREFEYRKIDEFRKLSDPNWPR